MSEKKTIYTIEDLEKTFKAHAVLAEKNNKRIIKEFQENNPGKPLPEHYTDDFNIAMALSTICGAILELKKRNSEKK